MPDVLAPGAWPLAVPFLELAVLESALCETGARVPSIIELEDDVREGFNQLWLVADGYCNVVGAGVTQLLWLDPNTKICEIRAFGGDMKACKVCLSTVEGFADAEGCKSIRTTGRRGWLRVLSGWVERGSDPLFFEKDLGGI